MVIEEKTTIHDYEHRKQQVTDKGESWSNIQQVEVIGETTGIGYRRKWEIRVNVAVKTTSR